MSKKPKPFHHGNLRRALIATATETIREHGVEAVTMRGLSQAIGVSRTAAYRHFENKRDLL
jgi:AcrR family transcriptional regulator